MAAKNEFLRTSNAIDWDNSSVLTQARALAHHGDAARTASACFKFVRDRIKHSRDFEMNPSTWKASDVLLHGTGYCYAKSHLLAALLRANGLPAGLCYQRLSVNDAGPPYCLHGFNAVDLPDIGWYRMDARGNKPGVDARFTPPREQLAFALLSEDEVEFENIFAEPLEVVTTVLRSSPGWRQTLATLPDVEPAAFDRLGLTIRRRGPLTPSSSNPL